MRPLVNNPQSVRSCGLQAVQRLHPIGAAADVVASVVNIGECAPKLKWGRENLFEVDTHCNHCRGGACAEDVADRESIADC